VNKQFRLHRIVFDGVCLCLCVPTTEHGYIMLEKKLREILVMKTEGVGEG
jgi:hypothetical protein